MRDINNLNQSKMKVSNEMISQKIGYDWRIKMMLCRVTPSLIQLIETPMNGVDKSWANVVRLMFTSEGITDKSVNGYYNCLKRNLKEIGIIRYEGKDLVKGSNWNRFISNEDWSWFVLNTDSNGHAKIVK
jgi:hypothetical protein